MVNYRRDCHNNPIAKDDPNYSWLGNVKSDAAEDIRWRATCKGNALQSISMDMTTAPEAAKLRGVNRQRVCVMAREGKIPGAEKIGGIWLIPVEWAKQPNNKRTPTD